MEGRVKLLNQILRGNDKDPRWPVSRIKTAFTPEDVRAWSAPSKGCFTAWKILMPLLSSMGDDRLQPGYWETHVAWCIEYLTWIVDELHIPFNGPVFPASDPRSEMTALDCLLSEFAGLTRVPCALFLLRRGAQTGLGWDDVLFQECARLRDSNLGEPIIKAVLDKGCFPPIECSIQVPRIGHWFVARLRTKEVCLLILALGRRRTQWSSRVPYGVWKMVAQHMWAHRWNIEIWRTKKKGE